MSHVSYANAIASMMYAIVFTHLDISYAVSMVSRYTSTSSKKTLTSCERIFLIFKRYYRHWFGI